MYNYPGITFQCPGFRKDVSHIDGSVTYLGFPNNSLHLRKTKTLVFNLLPHFQLWPSISEYVIVWKGQDY